MKTIINTLTFFTMIILLGNSTTVFANTVTYENVSLVNRSPENDTGFLNDDFCILESGMYEIVLSDFDFPHKFKRLELAITTGIEKVLQLSAGESQTFIAQPGKHYLGLVYEFDSKDYLGMYGIQIRRSAIATVPLPATIWMMMVGLALFTRYKRKQV